jgi:uncharacterized OB-fold protein
MTAADQLQADEAALDLPAPPQPLVDPDTEPFWAALDRGELVLCRCTACRTWLQPPLERCRHCAAETTFERASAKGTVHSFIVVRHPSVPAFVHLIPYAIVMVELEEGVRLHGRFLGDPDRVSVGLAVEARTERMPKADHAAVVFVVAGTKA